MLISFKLENGIYNMLQHFWTCNAAFLVNMPDEQDRCMCFLCETENRCRTFSYLGNTSGRGFYVFSGNSLYGVDDN